MDRTPSKRVVANFCQDKNDNEYNKDLEMDMHPVIKPHNYYELGKHAYTQC